MVVVLYEVADLLILRLEPVVSDTVARAGAQLCKTTPITTAASRMIHPTQAR
jgi:hypothetical protein